MLLCSLNKIKLCLHSYLVALASKTTGLAFSLKMLALDPSLSPVISALALNIDTVAWVARHEFGFLCSLFDLSQFPQCIGHRRFPVPF